MYTFDVFLNSIEVVFIPGSDANGAMYHYWVIYYY